MDNALQLLKKFCAFDFLERDCEKAVSVLTDDISWFGTSDREDVHDLTGACAYIASEIKTMPMPYRMTVQDESYTPITQDSGVAFLRVSMENQGVIVSMRLTAASRVENGVAKLCTMHFSVSDREQQPDEYFPLRKGKEKIAQEKINLVLSTMAGGLVGCYQKPGLPFYFVNHRMLEYLGYGSEAEFVADIEGLVSNMMHPEDRARVDAEVMAQLNDSNHYAVDYRMRRQDGSYIWVHDIGQKTVDENGEEVVISACYDVTREHDKQAQIDNIINALPGGVALYRMENGNLKVLYQSQGVGRLIGRTPAEYAELIQKTAKDSICQEDVDRVFSALQQAADSEKCVSLDYRVPHKKGGNVWINGSFQKTGMENGCPIIHAVFTEMPQLQELFRNITEYGDVAIVVSDNKTHELLYVNQEILSILNKTNKHYEGQFCYEYLLGEKKRCAFCKELCGNERMSKELYIPQLNRFFMTHGRILNWAGRDAHIEYLTDITETKNAQHKFAEMLQNITCGVVVSRKNPQDGSYEIEYMNEGFCKLLEGTEDELRERYRKDVTAGIHPGDVEQVRRMVAFTSDHALKTAVLRFLFPNGRIKWLHVDYNGVLHPDGMETTYITYYDVTTQMQQEQQLRASERALDVATEKAGLWFWKYDPVNDRAYFNRKSMEDFDLPEVLHNYSQAWLDKGIILPEYRWRCIQAMEKIKAGVSQAIFEAQIQFRDGIVHWGELRFTNLPGENGMAGIVVCTAHLIDDEKALRAKYEVEKQKPSLGEKNLLFHAIFNLDTGETAEYGYVCGKKRLEQTYPTFAEAVDYAVDAVVGEKSKTAFLNVNNITFLKKQMKWGNVSFSVDYRRKQPDGRILWVRNILHLVSDPITKENLLFEYCYDVHEQKMAQEVLNFAAGYDYELVACVDFQIGTMKQYGAFGDLKSNELVGYDVSRRDYANGMVVPEDRTRFLKDCRPSTVMQRVAEDGTYVFTTRVQNSNGTQRVIKTRFVPYDAAHQIYIMTRTDVTEVVRGEEEKNARLRDALTIAQQANSAKSDFLASMSHDIRTPMNAIVGMCELALEDEEDPTQVHESLQTIQSSSQLLLSLINNILDMSRIESGKMTLVSEPFSLTQEISEVAQSYRVLAQQKQQTFQLHVNLIHDRCCGDAARIHSALDNVLSNAIKYTPRGGIVTYRISEVASQKRGIGRYRFAISDTGVGMDEETQKHVFEPFYRAADSMVSKTEGTGLGLSITKAIIDLKGGTISVKSAKGSGTTVVVELPIPFAMDEENGSKSKGGADTKTYDLSQVRVLLCEDHPVNQKVAVRILEKAGASVIVAQDGQVGVDLFLKQPVGFFNIILMDIRMPKLDGYAATRAIRQSGHCQANTIPIVAMTANAFAEDVQKSMSAGMNDHLAKPIVPAVLYETILRYVNATARKQVEKTKVLFVSDSGRDAASLIEAVREDYQVFVAADREAVWSTLEKNQDMAAVLLDIPMPDLDSGTFIKTVRADDRYRKLVLIVMTQYDNAEQTEALLATGADDFLCRPTTPILVKKRLKDALHRRMK